LKATSCEISYSKLTAHSPELNQQHVMNKDLLNILSNSNKDIDNQKLMDYVAGKLSAEEAHEVEKVLLESDFTADAADGLSMLDDKSRVTKMVYELNANLKHQLQEKKKRKLKRRLKDQPLWIMTLVIFLILIVLCYLVVHYYLKAI
jgi:anti-sigma-K factor RskA